MKHDIKFLGTNESPCAADVKLGITPASSEKKRESSINRGTTSTPVEESPKTYLSEMLSRCEQDARSIASLSEQI
jgi:hypothetical protein